MHAVTLPRFGDPDVLTWTEVDDPRLADDEVLVEVAASAVNRADVLQRQGNYTPPPGASDIPGLECSGRIAAVGASVTGWGVGDEVCALLSGGGYAQLVAVPAGQLLPVPPGVELVTAAALPEVTCTVWSNVMMLAGLAADDVFLVHGGSSGIGTMAIQLAVRAGARVFATASSERKREVCRELGADVAIDYRTEDFVARVRKETDGHGADVVLDNMGAAYLARNVDVLATGGRLVVIGMQGGVKAELDLGVLLRKRASVAATALRGRPATGPGGKSEIVAEVREHVWPAVGAGQVRPVVDRVVPMADAAQAHRLLESSTHIGKVLLAV